MTMQIACWAIWWTGAYPLWHAWRANRRTSLLQAVNWAVVAWAAWGWALAPGASAAGDLTLPRYLALCLTGCAAVAVLGARRPGVGAWNFVVIGLLAVMLLPLAETLIAPGALRPGLRTLLLGGTVAVGVINYLPTRLATAGVLLGIGFGFEMLEPGRPGHAIPAGPCILALVPWAAYAALARRRQAGSEFDRLWLEFRDRFGLFWSQRVREQFNRSAANAGWPVYLSWQGLRLERGTGLPEPATQEEMVGVLRALLKRFGPGEP